MGGTIRRKKRKEGDGQVKKDLGVNGGAGKKRGREGVKWAVPSKAEWTAKQRVQE